MELYKDETSGKSGWKKEVFLGGLVGEKKRRKRRREVGITKICKVGSQPGCLRCGGHELLQGRRYVGTM